MKADKLWEAVDAKVEDIRKAHAAMDAGADAMRVLSMPAVEGHFKQRFAACIETMLTCPDADLIRWRANAAALIDFYTSLTSAVAAGSVNAQRLAEINPKQKE